MTNDIDGSPGDTSVDEACKALGDAGITPAVLMLTVANLLPDVTLRKQLQAAAQRATTAPSPSSPLAPSQITLGGSPISPSTQSLARRSPEQQLADGRAAAAKIGKAKADAVTFAAEASKRRRAKRTAAEDTFNAAIDEARKQLDHDLAQLAAFVEHENAVDAAHAAADAAATARFDKELAEANRVVLEAEAAAIAAGDARTLRPAPTAAEPIAVDDPPSDSEDLLSVADDDFDDTGDFVDMPTIEYVCPPTCPATLCSEDMSAAASARSVLCHWFAQPTAVPLTFGQLAMPITTVQTLVGEVAWARDFDLTATPSAEDTVPRPLGGVLLDALGRLHFDAAISTAPSGLALSAIKAAAARAAFSKKVVGVNKVKANSKRSAALKTCGKSP